jgi:hypothetical protein
VVLHGPAIFYFFFRGQIIELIITFPKANLSPFSVAAEAMQNIGRQTSPFKNFRSSCIVKVDFDFSLVKSEIQVAIELIITFPKANLSYEVIQTTTCTNIMKIKNEVFSPISAEDDSKLSPDSIMHQVIL